MEILGKFAPVQKAEKTDTGLHVQRVIVGTMAKHRSYADAKFSSDMQRSESIDTQLRAMRKYAK